MSDAPAQSVDAAILLPFPARRERVHTALATALHNIDVAFDPRNRRVAKRIARTLLRRSAHDGEVRAKYGWLAAHVDDARIGLRGAILLIDCYRRMAAAGATAVRIRGTERAIDHFSVEAIRVVLRFIRRTDRDGTGWPAILDALCAPAEQRRAGLRLVAAE